MAKAPAAQGMFSTIGTYRVRFRDVPTQQSFVFYSTIGPKHAADQAAAVLLWAPGQPPHVFRDSDARTFRVANGRDTVMLTVDLVEPGRNL